MDGWVLSGLDVLLEACSTLDSPRAHTRQQRRSRPAPSVVLTHQLGVEHHPKI